MKRKALLCTAVLLTLLLVSGCGQKFRRRPSTLLHELALVYGHSTEITAEAESSSDESSAVPDEKDEPVQTAEESYKPDHSQDPVIESLINAYGSRGQDRVDQLLGELKDADDGLGERWEGILDYWKYVNDKMPINEKALPGDLPRDDSLCIVVLGYELNPDGTMKDELIGRLETALACARQYPNAYVLCTGGRTALYDNEISEGERMRDWLRIHGIESSRLIVENDSTSTAENAENSYAILHSKYPRVKSVAIVSSNYHIPWGALMFETVFRTHSANAGKGALHVVSNCAYDVRFVAYGKGDLLLFQTGGMLELLQNEA